MTHDKMKVLTSCKIVLLFCWLARFNLLNSGTFSWN